MLPHLTILLPNHDEDLLPDYLDLDSDNDSDTDVEESLGVDTNGDGLVDVPNTLFTATPLPDYDNVLGADYITKPINLRISHVHDEDNDGILDCFDNDITKFGTSRLAALPVQFSTFLVKVE